MVLLLNLRIKSMNKKGKALLIGAEDEENLAIRYLGAVLKDEGHRVEVVPCSSSQDYTRVLSEVNNMDPDMVAVSMAFQSLSNIFFSAIQQIKEMKPEVHVTVGGHFPTFEYIKILENKHIDSLIRFEGEKPIAMLMDSLMNSRDLSNIPNILYKNEEGIVVENHLKPEFPDMDGLPFPLRRDKPQHRLGERFSTLVTSRGCFYSKCLYCCIGAFHTPKNGPKYALRTPKNIAKEIGQLYRDGVKLFQFHDDNFLLPNQEKSLKRVDSLKKALKDVGVDTTDIAIMIKTRPDSLHEDLVSSLVDIGTVGVFLGVENASEGGLKALVRGSTPDEIHKSLELLDKYPVSVTFNLLMFHPTAKLTEINDNIYFMYKNLERAFDFGRAEIVSGSPLERLVIRKGLLRGEWPQWDYTIEDQGVEKMFRISSLTFYRENSPYPDLSHRLIALSYRAQLLERFYPGDRSRKLSDKTLETIKKSNEFTLEKLLKIYQITAETEIKDEVNQLYNKMEKFYLDLNSKVENLSDKMLRFQLLERKFLEHGVGGSLQNSRTFGKIFRI